MKLSVITICYNIKDEIERTCKSIVSQTNQDFEWIVVDGGSTDGTKEILEKYQDKMTVFISEPDKGIYNAMNKGIKRATGEYLNFMNGGDCFAANDVVEKFLKYPKKDVDILYSNCNIISKKGSKPANIPHKVSKEYFYNGYTINHQASFIRHSLFDKYGLYNENYKIVSDWEQWIIFFINNAKFVFWQEIVANFYDGGISSIAISLHDKEVTDVCRKYYTEEEINKLSQMQIKTNKKYEIKLFGFLPFLNIRWKKNKRFYKIFNFLPIYKIKKKGNKSRHYLFGFIPFLKIKEK